MAIKGAQKQLGATDSLLRLSDYPIGSPQSRAAARALLDCRREAQGQGTVFYISIGGRRADPNRKCTCRKPEAGTFAVCRCFL